MQGEQNTVMSRRDAALLVILLAVGALLFFFLRINRSAHCCFSFSGSTVQKEVPL